MTLSGCWLAQRRLGIPSAFPVPLFDPLSALPDLSLTRPFRLSPCCLCGRRSPNGRVRLLWLKPLSERAASPGHPAAGGAPNAHAFQNYNHAHLEQVIQDVREAGSGAHGAADAFAVLAARSFRDTTE